MLIRSLLLLLIDLFISSSEICNKSCIRHCSQSKRIYKCFNKTSKEKENSSCYIPYACFGIGPYTGYWGAWSNTSNECMRYPKRDEKKGYTVRYRKCQPTIRSNQLRAKVMFKCPPDSANISAIKIEACDVPTEANLTSWSRWDCTMCGENAQSPQDIRPNNVTHFAAYATRARICSGSACPMNDSDSGFYRQHVACNIVCHNECGAWSAWSPKCTSTSTNKTRTRNCTIRNRNLSKTSHCSHDRQEPWTECTSQYVACNEATTTITTKITTSTLIEIKNATVEQQREDENSIESLLRALVSTEWSAWSKCTCTGDSVHNESSTRTRIDENSEPKVDTRLCQKEDCFFSTVHEHLTSVSVTYVKLEGEAHVFQVNTTFYQELANVSTARLEWHLNGVKLKLNPSRMRLDSDQTTLSIDYLEFEDTGVYTCKLIGDNGDSTLALFGLIVLSEQPNYTLDEKKSSVLLKCNNVTLLDRPLVQWMFQKADDECSRLSGALCNGFISIRGENAQALELTAYDLMRMGDGYFICRIAVNHDTFWYTSVAHVNLAPSNQDMLVYYWYMHVRRNWLCFFGVSLAVLALLVCLSGMLTHRIEVQYERLLAPQEC